MKKSENKLPAWALSAENALKEAVAEAIEEHRRKGFPIVIWRDGKIVHIPPEDIPALKSGVDK